MTVTAPAMVSDDLLQRSPTRVSGDIEAEESNLCLVGDLKEKIGIEALRAGAELTRVRFSNIESRIHRFPAGLREFGTRMYYIVPRVVAIGPYHHRRQPELQEMEEVKRMAAYSLCEELECSPDEVYGRIQLVERNAREYYVDVDALESFSDDDFAVMLFLDGCFLLQCLRMFEDYQLLVERSNDNTETLRNVIISKGISNILRDMMLLENQIPWPVLQLLIDLKPNVVPMEEIIGDMLKRFSKSLGRPRIVIDEKFRPPHLLGLIRFYQVGAMEVMKRSDSIWPDFMRTATKNNKDISNVTSAAELAEIGVKLTPSGTCRFSDMNLVRGPLLATLSLPPLFFNGVTPCWLVNMAAFEQCAIPFFGDYAGGDPLGVNSYLRVLSQLMNREDDVRELCNRGVLHSTHGHKQMLRFFANVAPFLLTGQSHDIVLIRLAQYKNYRWILIAIYKFLYNNGRIIATVLSIAGVLVGIFKALLSIAHERHKP